MTVHSSPLTNFSNALMHSVQPSTVADLIDHYKAHELTLRRKAFSTIDSHTRYLDLHIGPTWGSFPLAQVRTVAVEGWLECLPYTPGTRAKIRNIFSGLFSHAIRCEFVHFNPISKVRASAARVREPEVLSADEFQRLLRELRGIAWVAVYLAGTTGLRRSELQGLQWKHIDFSTREIRVVQGSIRNRIGKVKTVASLKPLPLHDASIRVLQDWRSGSLYAGPDDFVLSSTRMNGAHSVWLDTLMAKTIRPALERAGIQKTIAWHTFRHSLATTLISLGVDVKHAQDLLRHASCRITLDIYTRSITLQKRAASELAFSTIVGAETQQHMTSAADASHPRFDDGSTTASLAAPGSARVL